MSKLISKGSYGMIHTSNNDDIVIKSHIKQEGETKYDISRSSLVEIAVLQKLNGKQSILEMLKFKDNLDISLKRYDNNLSKFKFESVTKPVVYQMMYDLAIGLKAIHDNGLVHCDLKPENILFKKNKVAICDFGMSQYVHQSEHDTCIQTLFYRCPEILKCFMDKTYSEKFIISPKIDIWSLGVIFMEMLCNGNVMFNCNNEDELLLQFTIVFGNIGIDTKKWDKFNLNGPKTKKDNSFIKNRIDNLNLKENSDNICELLLGMLNVDPDERYSIHQVLNSKFFESIRGPKKLFPKEEINSNILISNLLNEKIQTDINEKMLAILFDWLYDINQKFRMSIKIFLKACDLVIMYLFKVKTEITRQYLQLVGACCYYISQHILVENPAIISDLKYLCDDVYTLSQLKETSIKVFLITSKNMFYQTEVDYILKIGKCESEENINKAIKLCVCLWTGDLLGTQKTPYKKAKYISNIVKAKAALYSITEKDEYKPIDNKELLDYMKKASSFKVFKKIHHPFF